jgi:hypothetical protein
VGLVPGVLEESYNYFSGSITMSTVVFPEVDSFVWFVFTPWSEFKGESGSFRYGARGRAW